MQFLVGLCYFTLWTLHPFQPDVIRLAREIGVIMLCLPPHKNHETQPLDCGVFSPLKTHWTTVCHNFSHKNPGKVITKFNFNSVLSKAWFQSLTPANLIARFKTCGVYPLNRTAIIVAPCSSNVSGSDDDPSGSGSNVVSGDNNVAASGDDNIATSDGGNDVCDNLSSDESNVGDNLPDSKHPLRTLLFDSEQEEFFLMKVTISVLILITNVGWRSIIPKSRHSVAIHSIKKPVSLCLILIHYNQF